MPKKAKKLIAPKQAQKVKAKPVSVGNAELSSFMANNKVDNLVSNILQFGDESTKNNLIKMLVEKIKTAPVEQEPRLKAKKVPEEKIFLGDTKIKKLESKSNIDVQNLLNLQKRFTQNDQKKQVLDTIVNPFEHIQQVTGSKNETDDLKQNAEKFGTLGLK